MSTTGRPHAPRAKRARLAVAALVAAAVSFVGFAQPVRAQTQPDPILFVHGWNSSASTWNTMISRFQNAGYPSSRLMAITYNSNQSNATIAQQVASAASTLRSRTGASEIDIIAHSMGSLSSRHYVKFLGGTASVDEWVSLGGPNHGTNTAFACWLFSAGCRDMVPGSSFLDNLNAGDETPPGARYGTFYSNCDAIINPDTSVVLSGATNTNVGCVGHSSLQSEAGVFSQVLNFVR